MTNKALIFLDIDGTLLRPNYTTNSEKVPDTISLLSKKGFLFCLNSNRSWTDLKPIVKKFHINGPVIGENGAFFIFKNKTHKLTKNPLSPKLVLKILKHLSVSRNASVIHTDTVRYSWKKLERKPLAWVINKYRNYTASIHVRCFGEMNLKAAKKLAHQLKQILGQNYTITVSPIFCNVLITPKDCDKGTGITALKNKFFRTEKFIMIGDDSADLSTHHVVHEFYAVGNAETKLKKRALYTAQNTYTKGVQEILQKFI